jgi:hypothetical protein
LAPVLALCFESVGLEMYKQVHYAKEEIELLKYALDSTKRIKRNAELPKSAQNPLLTLFLKHAHKSALFDGLEDNELEMLIENIRKVPLQEPYHEKPNEKGLYFLISGSVSLSFFDVVSKKIVIDSPTVFGEKRVFTGENQRFIIEQDNGAANLYRFNIKVKKGPHERRFYIRFLENILKKVMRNMSLHQQYEDRNE